MYKNDLTYKLSDDEASRFAARHRELPRRGFGLSPGVRSPLWPGILATLATLAIIGLLLTFHQVVRGAVQQGELRRQATSRTALQPANTPQARQLNTQYALDSHLDYQLNK